MRLATSSIIAAFLLAIFTTALWPDGSRIGVPTVVAQDEDPFGTSKPAVDQEDPFGGNSDEDPFGGHSYDSNGNPFVGNGNSASNDEEDPFGTGSQNPFGGKPVATKPNPKTTKPIKKANTAADLKSQICEELKSESSFEFDETPFIDVMEFIQTNHKFNVLLHASATEDSLSQDTTITFRANKLPLSSALKLMLEQYLSLIHI